MYSSPKIWYTDYKGYIVKSYFDPITNKIIQEKIPYNHPRNNLYSYNIYKSHGKKE